jgi:hypothetical protein
VTPQMPANLQGYEQSGVTESSPIGKEQPQFKEVGRDDFYVSVKRTVAARVGSKCSNPDCRAPTTGPTLNPDASSNVGIAAHITAASAAGPRFEPNLTVRARKSADNAIWLCSPCAKKIDDDAARYTVLMLRFWKKDAEDMADREKGRPTVLAAALRLAAIRLDPSCRWNSSHRRGKVATRLGGMPEIAFHEIPQQAWKDLGIDSDDYWGDPTFDLTWVNHAPKTTVLSSIGFEAVEIWSDLKGYRGAYKVPVLETLMLSVTPITAGVSQMIELQHPIAIEAGAVARLKLTLVGFRASLPGNESLIRMHAIANDELHQSRLINMGVY